jgi:hypothetical protein
VTGSAGVLDLYINEGFVPMVDGSLVYHRGFRRPPECLDRRSPIYGFGLTDGMAVVA